MSSEPITRSYAAANRELLASWIRYLEATSYSECTIKEYRAGVSRFIETLSSASVVETHRTDIRTFFGHSLQRGVSQGRIAQLTAGLRSFYEFLLLAGFSHRNPMAAIAHRKVPRHRLPYVLSVGEVEKLIAAAANPFERAVIEVLYATGVRVSEFVNLRLENIDFAEHVILVKKGKGGKDRYVLFGRHAAKVMAEYLRWRPSKTFLFETTAHTSEKEPSGRARPYQTRAIRLVLQKVSHRAGLPHVHPHGLRRAMASHMLSRGANLRVVQELLGHESLDATQLYTFLSASELKKIHTRCHPHAGGSHAEATED